VKKISAFILLMALAAFFIEAVTLPADCSRKIVSKCAMMMEMQGQCKMMAEKMLHHQQKKSKCPSHSCIDCPLCVVTTYKASISFIVPKFFHKREYAVVPDNDLSDYHSQQWKPPDAFTV
jgi:hypothetical protein